MNESHERRGPEHDRNHRIWPWQVISKSHKPRYRSNVTASLVKSTRPKVVPSHMLDDEETGPEDHEQQEAR